MKKTNKIKLSNLFPALWFFIIPQIIYAVRADIPWHQGISSWQVIFCVVGLGIQLALLTFATIRLLKHRN